MAKPITDPLRANPDDDDADLNDPQHEEISKGMPARNYKMWLLGAGAVGVAAVLAWPTHPAAPKAPAPETTRSQKDLQPGEKIVTSLISDANERKAAPPETAAPRPAAGTAHDPGVGANGASATGALFGQASPGGAPQMTPEEKEEARRQSILASATEATEVALPMTPFSPRESRADQEQRESADQRRALGEAQMKLIDSINNGTFNPGGSMAARAGAGGAGAAPGASGNDSFLEREGAKGIPPAQHMTAAREGLALYQGTIVRTVLDKAINTDLPGSIRAHVTSDVYDSINGTRLLIPRGSVVVGEYSTGLVVGQDRVLVALNRLILPNGQSVSLLGTPASDAQGVSGLAAEVDNHFLKMFGSSLMVGAASLLLPRSQQNITVNTGGLGGTQTGGTVFATTLQETVKNLAQRNINIKPTGTIDLGEAFTFTLSRDIVMDEYRGRKP